MSFRASSPNRNGQHYQGGGTNTKNYSPWRSRDQHRGINTSASNSTSEQPRLRLRAQQQTQQQGYAGPLPTSSPIPIQPSLFASGGVAGCSGMAGPLLPLSPPQSPVGLHSHGSRSHPPPPSPSSSQPSTAALLIQTTAQNILSHSAAVAAASRQGHSSVIGSGNYGSYLQHYPPSPGRPPMVSPSPPFLPLNRSWDDEAGAGGAALPAVVSSHGSAWNLTPSSSASAAATAATQAVQSHRVLRPRFRNHVSSTSQPQQQLSFHHYLMRPHSSSGNTNVSSSSTTATSRINNLQRSSSDRSVSSEADYGDFQRRKLPSSDRSVLSDSQLVGRHHGRHSQETDDDEDDGEASDDDNAIEVEENVLPVNEISAHFRISGQAPTSRVADSAIRAASPYNNRIAANSTARPLPQDMPGTRPGLAASSGMGIPRNQHDPTFSPFRSSSSFAHPPMQQQHQRASTPPTPPQLPPTGYFTSSNWGPSGSVAGSQTGHATGANVEHRSPSGAISPHSSSAQSHSIHSSTHANNQVSAVMVPTLPARSSSASTTPAEDDVSSLGGGVEDGLVGSNNAAGNPPAGRTSSLAAATTATTTTATSTTSLASASHASPSLQRMTVALKHGLGRPSSLTPDETLLWDVIQQRIQGSHTSLWQDSSKLQDNRRSVAVVSPDHHHQDGDGGNAFDNHDVLGGSDGGDADDDDWRSTGSASGWRGSPQQQRQILDLQRQVRAQQEEHERSLRAIQRVLADVTAERDLVIEKLQVHQLPPPLLPALHNSHPQSPRQQQQVTEELAQAWKQEKTQLLRDLDTKSSRVVSLERELKVFKVKRTTSPPSLVESTASVNNGLQQQEAALLTQKESELRVKEGEISSLQRDNHAKATRIATLERQLRLARLNKGAPKEIESLQLQIGSLQDENNKLTTDADTKAKEIKKLRQQLQQQIQEAKEAVAGGEAEKALRSELTEKSNALENAKMIITSLEHASGSLAADMRAKLKMKDDELTKLKNDYAEKQKMVDSLATELREAQRSLAHQQAENNSGSNAAERAARFALSSRLEQVMAEVMAAAVVFESTQDVKTVERITDLLNDAAQTLKGSIDALENAGSLASSTAYLGMLQQSGMGNNSSHSGNEIVRLRKEAEEKTAAIKRLEESLRQQKAEVNHVRAEMESLQKKREGEVKQLHAEMLQLRDQCNTNMEVLTRKERELVVLRDSLKVEDDVGYISDDASETEDTDEMGGAGGSSNATVSSAAAVASTLTTTLVSTQKYGPSQAEALATLLSHGGQRLDLATVSSNTNLVVSGGSGEMSVSSSQELETLKAELRQARSETERVHKQLRIEKESLANAKMIISSLEKANKSMMEDLRSRLHDSSTAIASLVEKSMGSEKTVANLKMELDQLKREKADDLERYQSELSRLRRGPALFSVESSSDMDTCFSVLTLDEKKEEALVPAETID